MITVKDLQGNIEALADYKDFEIYEEVNGVYSTSFTSFLSPKNEYAYPLIQEESIIEYEGHEFRVKKLNVQLNRKTVSAQHIFFDLIDHQVYDIFGGTKTLQELMSFVLSGTGWTFEIMDSFSSQFVPNFGEGNALNLIRQLCTVFECELSIEANKHLKIFHEIGKDEDVQFRYKHNIKAIREERDTTKLTTVIKGYGGNDLTIEYRSPNISLFGERHAEPLRDDRYTVPESLTEALKRELQDKPEVTIEIEAAILENVSLGDKVWVIHEALGLDYQSRVMAIKRYPHMPSKNTVILSNKKQNVITDILTEVNVKIDENAKETRTKFEQTNEKFLLQAERIDESIATFEITADEIKQTVNAMDVEIEGLDGKVASAETQISVQAGQIANKVSATDYNGSTITSKITQDPYSISYLAQQLNFNGLATFENLETPGQTRIDGGNIYGQRFVVGNGTGSTLTMTAINGSHSLHSNDAAGFRLSSNGSISLAASSGYGVYVTNAPLVAQSGFRVDGGSAQFFNTSNQGTVTVNGTLRVTNLDVTGSNGLVAVFG